MLHSRGLSRSLAEQRVAWETGSETPKVSGVRVEAQGFYMPKVWDVSAGFGGADGSLAGYVGNQTVSIAAHVGTWAAASGGASTPGSSRRLSGAPPRSAATTRTASGAMRESRLPAADAARVHADEVGLAVAADAGPVQLPHGIAQDRAAYVRQAHLDGPALEVHAACGDAASPTGRKRALSES
jgi:hypothetical protein